MRRIVLGLGVSLLFLYLALREQDFRAIAHALRNANYWWLLPAVAVYFVGVVFRSYRWAVLIRPLARVAWRDLFPVVAIGYMANNLLPFRTGEIVRAYALHQRLGVSRTATLATILIERVLDGLTMLVFILLASPLVVLGATFRQIVWVAAAIFLPLLGVTIVVAWSARAESLLRRSLVLVPSRFRVRAERMLTSSLTAVSVLRDGRAIATAGLLSLLAWLAEALMYGAAAQAFGIDLAAALVILTTAVANLATLIPSSPGYIGPFEAGVVLVLAGLAGVPRAAALSYALVLHAALYFPITALGLAFWWHQQLSWAVLRRAQFEEAPGP